MEFCWESSQRFLSSGTGAAVPKRLDSNIAEVAYLMYT